MSNLKVEGKVADFCPKCKNCKDKTMVYDGKKIRLTELKCEDPYDGMIKTLAADSDICCSMFEPKSDSHCDTKTDIIYEDDKVRGIKVAGWTDEKVTILKSDYDNLMDKVYKYDELKEKNDKDVMYSLHLGYELNKMKSRYETECKNSSNIVEENVELEREKAELIKASKRKDDLIQSYREKLKKANDEISLLNSKLDKLGEYYRTDEKLIDNIQKVIFPQEEGSDYVYSYEEILNKVKELKDKYEKLDTHYRYDEDIIKDIQDIVSSEDDSICSYSEIVKEVENLKIYADENKSMYEDLEYWKERCHKAETNVTTLNSKVGSLKNKIVNQQSTHYKQCGRILELENMVSKLQSGEYDDILAKDIEIKSLQAKYEDAMAGWKDVIDTNDKLTSEIDDLKEKNENLAKAVERRNKWVDELRGDVDTLQNECLAIAEIAKRAYDESNREIEEEESNE